MPAERCVKWEPVPGIRSACADISFSLDARDRLAMTMHFSFTVGRLQRDLLLTFSGPISIRWEQKIIRFEPTSDAIATNWKRRARCLDFSASAGRRLLVANRLREQQSSRRRTKSSLCARLLERFGSDSRITRRLRGMDRCTAQHLSSQWS